MSVMDDNLVSKTPQGENAGGEVVDTPVHPVNREGGEAAGTQPVKISGLQSPTINSDEAAQGNCMSVKDPSIVLPTLMHDDDSMEYEYLGKMYIDHNSYAVMRGRKQAKPNLKTVEKMNAARKRGVVIPDPDIYQDWDTSERFSPDSAQRQKLHEMLNLPIRVRVFKVKNAKKWAELHSCRANVSNGRDASTGDRRFQYEKACKLYHEEHGHYPNPNKLASMTLAKRAACVVFLREYLTKTDKPDKPSDDEPEQQQVIGKLRKVLAGMKGVDMSPGWIAGDGVQDILKEIAAEARRINVRQVKEADITPEQLKTFQRDNCLTMEKLGEILGVKHSAVSRWIRGKSKMTEHHQRAARELLRLTPEQLANITEGKEEVNES